MDELEVMFVWTTDGLVLQIVLDTGEQLHYEFDEEEVGRLFEFLSDKLNNKSIIAKVLKKLTDNNNTS